MVLIEGIGDDVISLFFIVFLVVILIISWLSTNVREFAFPANLLVIERRSRHLYTTSLNGNLNRSKYSIFFSNFLLEFTTFQTKVRTQHLSTSPTTTESSATVSNANRIQRDVSGIQIDVSNQGGGDSPVHVEVVDEIVEQALVENLLDGTFYSTNNIDIIQNNQLTNLNRSLPTLPETNQDLR